MDGELVLIGSGAEGEPRGGTNRKGFGKARCKGGEEGGMVGCGSSGVDPQDGDRAIGVNLGGKGEAEGTVGGTEDFRRNVRESSGYGVPIGVRGMDLSRSVEPAGCGREGGGFRRGGGGGRGRGEGCDARRRGLPEHLLLRGGGRGQFGVRASGADGVKVTRKELEDAGVATISAVGGLP